jgi:phosphoglycerate dehydrogenase-like enzyme
VARIAIGPKAADFAVNAVKRGGGQVVDLSEPAEALIWLSVHELDALGQVLDDQPAIRWVQFPFAGVENAVAAGIIDDKRIWTAAKGSYAKPVAEHALMLALAGLRLMPERIRAHSWGCPAGTSLHDASVTILGGGGITCELLRLLAPFRAQATVVRRQAQPVEGAHRTVTLDGLDEAIDGALVVFLALALTPQTRHVISKRQLEAMGDRSWLVNVARGGHVDTDALVETLKRGDIGGAALDVTDPEPLPDGHPLWKLPNCIITPHTADTWEMIVPLLSQRIQANVEHFLSGEPMEGLVDPHAGY